MKAIIITVGDEILIGQITDTNSSWLAEQLQLKSIEVVRMMSVSDEQKELNLALDLSIRDADLIILTGGLGPTKDDLTKKVLADYFDTELLFDEEVFKRIEYLLARFDRKPTLAHKEQAFMPKAAQQLFNKMGTAPGMLFEQEGKLVLSMPGVPYEMKYIFQNSFMPILEKRISDKAIYHKTIQTAGLGESAIAERIESVTDKLPDYIKIAFLPSLGKVRLRLSGSHNDEKLLRETIDNAIIGIHSLIPDLIFGFDLDSLESVLQKKCIEKGITLGTAESCTGGNISARITKIPGSSGYYMGSIISYSNRVKEHNLGVDPETIKQYGAVSHETVVEMVQGAIKHLGVDLAVAASGIAGPGGATEDKPVGTIHIACGNANQYLHRKLNLSKNRALNIEYTTNMALLLVLKFIEKYY